MNTSKLKLIPVLLLILIASNAHSQNTISLKEVQKLAKENYPQIKQKDILGEIKDIKLKELNSNYLPQISVIGQGTYQSEVTKLSLPAGAGSGVVISPDQYSVGIELKENLLDYGAIRTQKNIERNAHTIQSLQIDADLIKLQEKVNLLYGNIFLQQENKKIMQLRISELIAKKNKMKSAVKNGAALESSFLVLESEYLNTLQKLEEINSNLDAWYKSLSLLTNTSIDTTYVLQTSSTNTSNISYTNRPEIKLFESQSNTLILKEKLVNRTNLPKVFVFGRGYYGRPGYNFLDNDFRTYGMVGAGLNWNISSYYNTHRDKKILKLNNQINTNQKEIFEMNLQTNIIQQTAEISKLEKFITMDEQILTAKTSIRKSASSQLDNGVITASDYLVELNAENQADYNLKLHKIQLMMAKEALQTSLGNN